MRREERQHIKLALDTTHILGRGAVQGHLQPAGGWHRPGAARHWPELGRCELFEVAEELGCTRYVQGPSLKGQAEVDWTDPQARQRFLAEIVADAEQLLEWCAARAQAWSQGSNQDNGTGGFGRSAGAHSGPGHRTRRQRTAAEARVWRRID